MAAPGLALLAIVALAAVVPPATDDAPESMQRLKDVARIGGAHSRALVGYGIVTGLAGTGDSSRNKATLQSIANVIARFGLQVDLQDLASRNVAAVTVSASLPAYAEAGHPLDVQVTSLGDARSLTGGVLLLTPLYGPDERLYALARGSVVVGGHQFEAPGAQSQRNFPTAGYISNGALVERPSGDDLAPGSDGHLDVLLNEPDFSAAQRIADALGSQHPGLRAEAVSAGKVRVELPRSQGSPVRWLAQIEQTPIRAEAQARVVVNERTGTVVSGAAVRLGAVSISHGDLQVEIRTRYQVSQPQGTLIRPSSEIGTVVVPESEIETVQPQANLVSVREGASVGELVSALRSIRLSTRDVIAILQAIKTAGALRGELVIQ